MLLVRRIRQLLYEEGFTISGARNRLDEPSGKAVVMPAEVQHAGDNAPGFSLRAELFGIIELLRV